MDNDSYLETQFAQPSLSSELGRSAAKNAVGAVGSMAGMAVAAWGIRKAKEFRANRALAKEASE